MLHNSISSFLSFFSSIAYNEMERTVQRTVQSVQRVHGGIERMPGKIRGMILEISLLCISLFSVKVGAD